MVRLPFRKHFLSSSLATSKNLPRGYLKVLTLFSTVNFFLICCYDERGVVVGNQSFL